MNMKRKVMGHPKGKCRAPVRLASLTLLAAAALGLATAAPALAAPAPAVTAPAATTPVPVDFVEQTATPLPSDAARHEFTVTYTNTTAAPQLVAPQLLVTSPDAGPFLAPADIKLERRTVDGCWREVVPGSQTGTLFTELTSAQRTLAAGETLTETYRVTVLKKGAVGTVVPRTVIYG